MGIPPTEDLHRQSFPNLAPLHGLRRQPRDRLAELLTQARSTLKEDLNLKYMVSSLR